MEKIEKVIALCLRFGRCLQGKGLPDKVSLYDSVTVQDIQEAEFKILQLTQNCFFQLKFIQLKEKCTISQPSKLHQLNCFLDKDGLLRVGGRLCHSELSYEEKFPKVLPKQGHVTSLVISDCHAKVAHQGKGLTLNEVRSQGYWIINANSVVARFVLDCVVCRKNRGKVMEQKMSDLPEDRISSSQCFNYCACDYFGAFVVKQRRKEIKRYGALFVCMNSRAVHIELADSLSTDSFINVL